MGNNTPITSKMNMMHLALFALCAAAVVSSLPSIGDTIVPEQQQIHEAPTAELAETDCSTCVSEFVTHHGCSKWSTIHSAADLADLGLDQECFTCKSQAQAECEETELVTDKEFVACENSNCPGQDETCLQITQQFQNCKDEHGKEYSELLQARTHTRKLLFGGGLVYTLRKLTKPACKSKAERTGTPTCYPAAHAETLYDLYKSKAGIGADACIYTAKSGYTGHPAGSMQDCSSSPAPTPPPTPTPQPTPQPTLKTCTNFRATGACDTWKSAGTLCSHADQMRFCANTVCSTCTISDDIRFTFMSKPAMSGFGGACQC